MGLLKRRCHPYFPLWLKCMKTCPLLCQRHRQEGEEDERLRRSRERPLVWPQVHGKAGEEACRLVSTETCQLSSERAGEA